MLQEIRALIALADSGSLQKAAARLFLTPSAVTRQIQRLEATLGAPLLDRRLKPPVLTPAGRAVLERSRELLRSFADLKGAAKPRAEPSGSIRIGLAHPLAQPPIAAAIQSFTARFRALRPHFSSDVTAQLLERVRAAELDAALVLVTADTSLPANLAGTIVATEKFVPVRVRGENGSSHKEPLDPPGAWVVNPRGCFVRESLRAHLEKSGTPFSVAAEVHNLDLQLALVAAGIGRGVMPARVLARRGLARRIEVVRSLRWELRADIVFVRAGHLGQLELAAKFLEESLRQHYQARAGRPQRSTTSSIGGKARA
jgi:DNA-binding transcriptional LysR family regulator